MKDLLRGIKRITGGNCVIRSQLLRASTMPAAISHMAVIYKRCQNLWVTVGEKSNTWERSLFFPLLWYEGGGEIIPSPASFWQTCWLGFFVLFMSQDFNMWLSHVWRRKPQMKTKADNWNRRNRDKRQWRCFSGWANTQMETTAEGWAASIMTLVRLCRGNFIIQDYWRWFLIVDLITAASFLLHIPPAFNWC